MKVKSVSWVCSKGPELDIASRGQKLKEMSHNSTNSLHNSLRLVEDLGGEVNMAGELQTLSLWHLRFLSMWNLLWITSMSHYPRTPALKLRAHTSTHSCSLKSVYTPRPVHTAVLQTLFYSKKSLLKETTWVQYDPDGAKSSGKALKKYF